VELAPLHEAALVGVSGEVRWRVPPLGVPEAAQPSRVVDDVRSSEAASLFLERAQAALPGFSIDDRTARAVAAICSRLEGLPLAIELAAARMQALVDIVLGLVYVIVGLLLVLQVLMRLAWIDVLMVAAPLAAAC